MGSIGRCCCLTCVIDSDDFDRADAATLGAQWDDWSNVWTIDNNEAVSTGAGNARFDVIHPVPDESMVVYVETRDEVADSGDKYRVLVNVLDADNYHFAEFTRNGANDSTLALGSASAGVETVAKTETILGLTGTSRQIVVTIAENEFCANVTNSVLSLVTTVPTLISGGYWSGIGSAANPI